MRSIKPLIPYFGGKRRIAPQIAHIVRSELREESVYYEPFVGAGAVYLELEHPNSVIGDIVPDLINMYECIRDDYERVAFYYDKMPNTEKRFYQIRDFDRSPYYESRDRFFKAARYIFLCRTSFGSCRWNQLGQMNRSYGKNPERPYYLDSVQLLRISRLLKTTDIRLDSFDDTLKTIKKGDVAYLDPPYIDTVYDQYWLDKFKKSDIKTLKQCCDDLENKGAKFILSHSFNTYVQELYQDYTILSYDTYRDIKSRMSERYDKEVLITNIDNVEEILGYE